MKCIALCTYLPRVGFFDVAILPALYSIPNISIYSYVHHERVAEPSSTISSN